MKILGIKNQMNEVKYEILYSYMRFGKWKCARVFFEPRSRLAHPEGELDIKGQNSRSSEQTQHKPML